MAEYHRTLFLFFGAIGVSIASWLFTNAGTAHDHFVFAFVVGVLVNELALLHLWRYKRKIKE